jgi:hypothetical protein
MVSAAELQQSAAGRYWEGWLVFFPLSGGPAVATNRETTQASYDALVEWADASEVCISMAL